MNVTTEDQLTHRLKSAVTKRKGRGFSKNESYPESSLKDIEQFDSIGEQTGQYQRSIEGWVIVVLGLNEETTEDDLQDKFADFGTIKDIRLPLDHRTGYVKGYALLEYPSFLEAKTAIDKMNRETFLDTVIQCDFAFIKSKK